MDSIWYVTVVCAGGLVLMFWRTKKTDPLEKLVQKVVNLSGGILLLTLILRLTLLYCLNHYWAAFLTEKKLYTYYCFTVRGICSGIAIGTLITMLAVIALGKRAKKNSA